MCSSGRARLIRLNAALSLAEIAAAIGGDPPVSPSTIFRWERGDRSPHGEAATRYCELLDDLLKQP